MHAALEDGAIVGGAGAFPFELSVPGGSLPCAGVTAVGVHPTHRRRGVLRAMMDTQLRDVHERGEPIAALWASEETIYGRFGYGIASWAGELERPARVGRLRGAAEPYGDVAVRHARGGTRAVPALYDGRGATAGHAVAERDVVGGPRTCAFHDDEKQRAAPLRRARGRRRAAGVRDLPHALRVRGRLAASRLVAREAFGATPQAMAAIWRFLLDVDWMAAAEAPLAPPDHPLFLLVATPRRCGTGWATVSGYGSSTSPPRSRAASTATAVRSCSRCATRSATWNDGRWRLEGGACERTDDEPDLALDVAALGSAYLGAVSFTQLQEALRVEELGTAPSRRADALFAWRPLPWCPEIF